MTTTGNQNHKRQTISNPPYTLYLPYTPPSRGGPRAVPSGRPARLGLPTREGRTGRRAPPRGVDVKQPPAGRPRGAQRPGRALRDLRTGSGTPGSPIPGSGISQILARTPRPGEGAPGGPGTPISDPAGVAFTSTPRGGALSPSGAWIWGPGPEPSGTPSGRPPRGTPAGAG